MEYKDNNNNSSKSSSSSSNNNNNNVKEINISNYQLAHMVAQIRCRQLSCEQSQNKLKDNIIINFEINRINKDRIESNNQILTMEIKNKFNLYCDVCGRLQSYLLKQKVEQVGYPNQNNKTYQQLLMAIEWIEKQGDSYRLIENLKNGIYLNGLSNSTDNTLIPTLESSSASSYWGNENPSVTSLILYGLNKILGYQLDEELYLVGCAKRVEYLNQHGFSLSDEYLQLIKDYPFANRSSMVLFGSYQYGGQRKFNKQYLFGPEDCSSSVGKASLLNIDQISQINTKKMIESYFISNNIYQFKSIVQLYLNVTQDDINQIEPGDIYLTNGHSGLFLTKPDYQNEALTIEFARNLNYNTQFKCEGGGIRKIKFNDKVQHCKYYVLRPSSINIPKLSISITLEILIKQIDHQYHLYFKSSIKSNIIGDSNIFIKSLINTLK